MSTNLARGSAEFLRAQSHIYKHLLSFISSMSLKCAVQLGIPDIINGHGQPMTLPNLVSALQLPRSKTGHVHRLMRLLVHNGFFARESVDETPDRGYVLTHSARFLLKGSGLDLSPFVLSMLHPDLVLPWHVLGDSIKDDRATTPFETAHGMAFWEFQRKNKHFRELFNEAMASDSRLVSLVVKDCRAAFEGLDSIVDVGGGTGTTMKIVSQEFPRLKCTVLDLPQVVAGLPSSPRLEYVAGDMFASIPSADAVLIKLVMHSLGDDECVKILKKCREAITTRAAGGKVIIIDIVLNEEVEEPELTEPKLYFDMLMMVVVAGKERCEKEWEKLFLAAGFSHYKITPIFGLRSLIEVFPS